MANAVDKNPQVPDVLPVLLANRGAKLQLRYKKGDGVHDPKGLAVRLDLDRPALQVLRRTRNHSDNFDVGLDVSPCEGDGAC